MRALFSDFLDSFQKILIHMIASKLVNKLVIINFLSGIVSNHVRIDNNFLLDRVWIVDQSNFGLMMLRFDGVLHRLFCLWMFHWE